MSVTNSHGRGSYACRTSHCLARAGAKIDDLDKHVTDTILNHLNLHDLIMVGNEVDDSAEIEEARKALEAAEYDHKLLATDRDARRTMGMELWNQELGELAEAVEEARINLDMLTGKSGEVELWGKPDFDWFRPWEAWGEWTDQSRREFLRGTIASLTIKSAQRRAIPAAERMTLTLRLNGLVTKDETFLTSRDMK